MPSTSQTSTVSFGGILLGELLTIAVQPATADIIDRRYGRYSLVSTTRYRRYVWRPLRTCRTIQPGGCQVTFYGSASLSEGMVGSEQSLIVQVGAGSLLLSKQAILETFEVIAEVGEFVRGSASFAFTGE